MAEAGRLTPPVSMIAPLLRGLFALFFASGLLELPPARPASTRLHLGRNAWRILAPTTVTSSVRLAVVSAASPSSPSRSPAVSPRTRLLKLPGQLQQEAVSPLTDDDLNAHRKALVDPGRQTDRRVPT